MTHGNLGKGGCLRVGPTTRQREVAGKASRRYYIIHMCLHVTLVGSIHVYPAEKAGPAWDPGIADQHLRRLIGNFFALFVPCPSRRVSQCPIPSFLSFS
jgi:hypothetical protein